MTSAVSSGSNFGYPVSLWANAVNTADDGFDRVIRGMLDPTDEMDAEWDRWLFIMQSSRLARLVHLAVGYDLMWRAMLGMGAAMDSLERAETCMIDAINSNEARSEAQEMGHLDVISMLAEIRIGEDGVLGEHWAPYGDQDTCSHERYQQLIAAVLVSILGVVIALAERFNKPRAEIWHSMRGR